MTSQEPDGQPSPFRRLHDSAPDRTLAERNTRRVIALTTAMMAIEVTAGWRFHSMALLADGWHMCTHVAAFLITAIAYALARRHRTNPRYSFGTGKFDVLGGYTSALILGVVAVFMAAESVLRFFEPMAIHYNESIVIGLVGLGVNVASALILKHDHGPSCSHSHGHSHAEDLNMKAAYVHVLADAVTSILAISALCAGKYLGWSWMDPVMGLVGSGVVGQWAFGLLRDTSGILLDRTPPTDLADEIRKAVESDGDASITDLHIWQVGLGQFYAIVSIAARNPKPPQYYHALLSGHEELRHVTVEVQRDEQAGMPAARP